MGGSWHIVRISPVAYRKARVLLKREPTLRRRLRAFLEVMAEHIIAENRKKAGNLDSDNSGDVSEGLVEAHYLLAESSLPEQ